MDVAAGEGAQFPTFLAKRAHLPYHIVHTSCHVCQAQCYQHHHLQNRHRCSCCWCYWYSWYWRRCQPSWKRGCLPPLDEGPRLPTPPLPPDGSFTAVPSAAAAGPRGLISPPLRSPLSLPLLPKDFRRLQRLRFEASFALGEPDGVWSERSEEEDGGLRPAQPSLCNGDCVLPMAGGLVLLLLRARMRLRIGVRGCCLEGLCAGNGLGAPSGMLWDWGVWSVGCGSCCEDCVSVVSGLNLRLVVGWRAGSSS